MAFKFFRERQKLVIGLMVVLMVAFLVPTGVRGLFQKTAGKQVIGSVFGDKLRQTDWYAAENDLKILQHLGLGQMRSNNPYDRLLSFFLRLNQDSDVRLGWAVLVKEAQKMGLFVNNAEVDGFLAAQRLDQEGMQSFLVNLGGITEDDVRRAVGDLMLVEQAYVHNRVNAWPSLPELRHSFRDLTEKIQLAMVALPAADYSKDFPQPSDEQIIKWFNQYKSFLAGDPNNKTDYGFGYRVPDKLDIQYLFIDAKAVEQAVEPSAKDMSDYWAANQATLRKTVTTTRPAKRPASGPASAASTGPTSGPTSAATGPTSRQIQVPYASFAEAKPEIRRILKEQAAEARVNELVTKIREMVASQGKLEQPYAKVAQAMTKPADELLSRPVKGLRTGSLSLEQVVEELQRVSGVTIVYPFGKHAESATQPSAASKWNLDGQVKVQVDGKWADMTLGQALDQLAAAHGYPKFKWVTAETFEGAIFSAEPIDLRPVTAGDTGMTTFEEITKNELLADACTSRGGRQSGMDTVPQIASTVFLPAGHRYQGPRIVKGEEYTQAMYVGGERVGRLIWRVAYAEPSHDPAGLTLDIHKQVIADVKTAYGFEQAVAAAKAMQAQVQSGQSLDELAKQENLKVEQTGLFSRKSPSYFGDIGPSVVPGVGRSEAFLDIAFTLVPADPEHPEADKPAAAVVPLQRQQKAMVIQRIGYEPSLRSEFVESGLSLAPALMEMRAQRELMTWVHYQNIIQRTGFVATKD